MNSILGKFGALSMGAPCLSFDMMSRSELLKIVEQRVKCGQHPLECWRQILDIRIDDMPGILGFEDQQKYHAFDEDAGLYNITGRHVLNFCRHFGLHPADLLSDSLDPRLALPYAIVEAHLMLIAENAKWPSDAIKSDAAIKLECQKFLLLGELSPLYKDVETLFDYAFTEHGAILQAPIDTFEVCGVCERSVENLPVLILEELQDYLSDELKDVLDTQSLLSDEVKKYNIKFYPTLRVHYKHLTPEKYGDMNAYLQENAALLTVEDIKKYLADQYYWRGPRTQITWIDRLKDSFRAKSSDAPDFRELAEDYLSLSCRRGELKNVHVKLDMLVAYNKKLDDVLDFLLLPEAQFVRRLIGNRVRIEQWAAEREERDLGVSSPMVGLKGRSPED